MLMDLLAKQRIGLGEGSLKLVRMSFPKHYVCDNLFNGKMTVFNRHYAGYSLVVH